MDDKLLSPTLLSTASHGTNISSLNFSLVVGNSKQKALSSTSEKKYTYIYSSGTSGVNENSSNIRVIKGIYSSWQSHTKPNYVSPLEEIINVLRQRYGLIAGSAKESDVSLFMGQQLRKDFGVEEMTFSPLSMHDYHGDQSPQMIDYEKMRKRSASKTYFDPIGEVIRKSQSFEFKRQTNSHSQSAHERFRSSDSNTNVSTLIRSVFTTELDCLMRQDGHSTSRKNLSFGIVESLTSRVMNGVDRTSNKKFCFSCNGSNRKAFDSIENEAAVELSRFLRILSHEMTLEQFAAAEADTFKEIFKLMHSSVATKRYAGVTALDALIDVPSSDEDKKAIKLANNLSNALRVGGDFEFLTAVSRTLGRLARKSGSTDFVEFEVTRGIEWLKTDKSERRLAAVLTLRELSLNAPTGFYSKTNQLSFGGSNEFLENILPIIRDPVPLVRAAAADAFAECIKVIIDKRHRSKTALLCKIHDGVMEGLKPSLNMTAAAFGFSIDASLHGSLMVAGEMLVHTGDFMIPRFYELCDAVLPLITRANGVVRLAVIYLIPRLAKRCPASFERRYLSQFLDYLLSSAKPSNKKGILDVRPASLLAIGRLALVFKSKDENNEGLHRLITRLTEIFDAIHEGLVDDVSGLKTKYEALRCASDIVESVGEAATDHIQLLLDHMFNSGLSESLIHSLHSIASNLPNMQTIIEGKILEEISLCLAGTSEVYELVNPLERKSLYQRKSISYSKSEENKLTRNLSSISIASWGLPRPTDLDRSRSQSRHSRNFQKERKMSMNDERLRDTSLESIQICMVSEPEYVEKLVLSLKTLGTLTNRGFLDTNFSMLLLFARDVTVQYLAHPHPKVRKEAALTCCRMLLPSIDDIEVDLSDNNSFPKMRSLGHASRKIVEELLQKLLQVAVSDPSPSVRFCVVKSLNYEYVPLLCQAHHVQPLFLMLQDEVSSIRETALELLGHLALHNPTTVLPYFRRMIMDLIIALRGGGDSVVGRESATRLLVVSLRVEAISCIPVIHPFLQSIVRSLPLTGVSPRLASSALEALGELSHVTGEAMIPWVGELIPHVLLTMQDQSSASKQRISFRALGQLVSGTGYVILPYIDYPNLLPLMTSVLPGAKRSPWILRREIMRTFGLIGALDPSRYSSMLRRSQKVRRGRVGGGLYIDAQDEEIESPVNREKRNDSASCDVVGRHLDDGNDDSEPAHLYMYEQYAMTAQPVSKLLSTRRLTPSDDDFYPTVVVQALTRILKDSSLVVHHGMVMQAIMYVFNALGLRCVPFLRSLVPHILHTIRICGQASLREALLVQVANLSGIVRDHLRPYIDSIFDVIELFWTTKHLETVLVLVEKLAFAMPDDIRRYAPRIIRLMISTIETSVILEWARDEFDHNFLRLTLVMKNIQYSTAKQILSGHLHLMIYPLVKLIDSLLSLRIDGDIDVDQKSNIQQLTLLVIDTISIVLTNNNSALYFRSSPGCGASTLSARAAQPLMRLLRDGKPDFDVGSAIVRVLCICAEVLGERWISFYHQSAQSAILDWEERVNVPEVEGNQESKIAKPFSFYCSTINEINSNHRHKQFGFGQGQQERVWSHHLNPILHREMSILTRDSDNESGLDVSTHLRPSRHLNDHQNQLQVNDQQNQLQVNQHKLQRAWDVSQRTSREDWEDWIKRFSVQLLREAPSPALRAAADLAHAYQPLARELFPAAFVRCWLELSEKYKVNLIQSLEVAFAADISPDILQTLLNLAEFMEHDSIDGGGLPIDISVLAELAEKCRAYAKALHYKEREYVLGSGAACVEALISINKKLELPEAANGILNAAQMKFNGHPAASSVVMRGPGTRLSDPNLRESENCNGIQVKESWLAELGNWSDALERYHKKLEDKSDDVDAILGCMRCYDARGDWNDVLQLASRSWNAFTSSHDNDFGSFRKKMSSFSNDEKSERQRSGEPHLYILNSSHREAIKFCSKAAWRLGQWESLETFASQLVRGSQNHVSILSKSSSGISDGNIPLIDFDGSFFSAILHIHRKEWLLAENAVDAARRAMDSSFTALLSESYKRSYSSLVTAQTLSELEEIIEFLKLESKAKEGKHRHGPTVEDVSAARQKLHATWRKRLAGCRVDAEVHSSIIAVRSLVTTAMEEIDSTLQLSALLRQSKCFKLAERTLCDPLTELGTTLDSPLFGYKVPAELNWVPGTMDRLPVKCYVSMNSSTYAFSHTEGQIKYGHTLIKTASGFDRLNIQHRLYYAYIKHLWLTNRNDEAMERLSKLCDVVELIGSCERDLQNESLRVACWLKLGDWKLSLSPSFLSNETQSDVLSCYRKAAVNVWEAYDFKTSQYNPSAVKTSNDYRALHSWALINFRLSQQGICGTNYEHVIAAVQGFVRAISLGTKRWSASVQQDMLNLLTCLFKYGHHPGVHRVINEGLEMVTLECWLGCTPQLLARIHIQTPNIRSTLHTLLIKLGAKHPQALMYPLSVLLKSTVVERKVAAESLMNSLKAHSNALVEEALLVSGELIRVAILWLELWHEGLEEASRLYFGDGNVSSMLDVLLPLHEQLEKGPSTRREVDFCESFGRDLSEAHNYIRQYMRLATFNGGVIPTQGGFVGQGAHDVQLSRRHNAEADQALHDAWDKYYIVFRRINKQIPGLTTLELSQVSPSLQNVHKLELGVPGTYRVDGSYVKIERFNPIVQVITSKQRPRKIVLLGSDGKDYVFLLKGHEDLRQDERVMQLFGLVNALLARDRRTNNYDLNIQRYVITPLSHHVGLVGWVPHTETIHSHIRDYRESKKIVLNMENREIMKMAPDYEFLTVLQKVEVFETALERAENQGRDLYDILFLKSLDSEEWLERRTNYTMSTAVMSMVGYILGLGDRHPSNLMLHSISGRILHIDFGDCFEVAMHREKFPEKVPFRLTRMLINAMEVSGVEGSYRSTCERTMGVLRDNKDSLVTMLEAFVHDPLFSWRLLNQDAGSAAKKSPQQKDSSENDRPFTRNSSSSDLLSSAIEEENEEDVDQGNDGEKSINNGEQKIRRNSSRPFHRRRSQSLSVTTGSHAAKSLEIYSNIQSLAANLTTSTRIASITMGSTAKQNVIDGSIAGKSVKREMHTFLDEKEMEAKEVLNEKALKVIQRVNDKLSGTDFPGPDGELLPVDVTEQVELLINQATSSEHLCQLFIGWCAFW